MFKYWLEQKLLHLSFALPLNVLNYGKTIGVGTIIIYK